MGLFSSIGNVFKSVTDVVSPISGILGAGLGFLGQKSANDTNQQIASDANATSIELANTAYQRRVQDLAAAGLNPMLAYSSGGASVPEMKTAQVQNTAEAASRTGANASTAALIQSQIANQASQTDLNSAEAAKVRAETANVPLQGQYTQALTSKVNPEIQQILSSSSLNSVNYNKVLKEIDLLDSQNRLTKANVLEVLSKTNLNKAEVSRISAEIPMINAKSFFGNAAETGAKALGEAIGNSAGAVHMYGVDLQNRARARRSAYEKR